MLTKKKTVSPAAVAALTLVDQAIGELRSNKCPCGNRKRSETPFCFHCLQVVREEAPDACVGLLASVKEGYIAAWQAAKDALRQNGRLA